MPSDPHLGRDFIPTSCAPNTAPSAPGRLRRTVTASYREIAGSLAHYAEDPYVDSRFSRAPVDDAVDVVVVGGGFGGLLGGGAAARGRAQSHSHHRKGRRFRRHLVLNRYPGAACDIESYIYLRCSKSSARCRPRNTPRRRRSLAHTQAVGRHFDLYRDALFQTEVKALRWDEGERAGASPPIAATA